MDYDFAILYFGLTRSTKKVYGSHIDNVFNILKENNLTYKTFMHTWKTKDNKQKVWLDTIPQEIDYNEYKLLIPDFYKLENQCDFIDNINMDNYYYQNTEEWLPQLIKNHLCALESMKRCFEMMEEQMNNGIKFKYIMFIRPDVQIFNPLPLHQILPCINKISIPNKYHYEGYNDRFAITNYTNGIIYAKRINEIIEFRKGNGRITSEKYLKFIIDKYGIEVNQIDFDFDLIRP
jgi:hypothetical protein